MPGHVTATEKFSIGQECNIVLTSHVGEKIHQSEERVKVKNLILPTHLPWQNFTHDMKMNNFHMATILFVVLLNPVTYPD